MNGHSSILVLDAMGVIYQACDDVAELLIPFSRENGCSLSDADIGKYYTDCSLGLGNSAELWRWLGLAGEAADINQRYLQRHRLNPGLMPFLEVMRRKNVHVACISNDLSEWSLQLRRSFQIEHYFFNWTISGDVHTRKPDLGIYEHFLKTAGVEAERCLFVDDRKKNLDAASRLGFNTVHFTEHNLPDDGMPHLVVKDFAGVEQCLERFNR